MPVAASPFASLSAVPMRWAMVSTYPPTPCGLATFTQALLTGLSLHGAEVEVVQVVDEPQPFSSVDVAHQFVNGTPGSVASIATALNGYDLVILQHEYGIYGGTDGDEVLALLARLRVPVMTVLHTVLASPSHHQRHILQSVVRSSDALVTMTRTARERVITSYGADPERVHVIPHGAAEALVSGPRPSATRGAADARPAGAPFPSLIQSSSGPIRLTRRPIMLTWGLLGTGKGIEWGIEALATLRDLSPSPVYVVAGQTHPRVLERDGEGYRRGLESRTLTLGLLNDVVFDDRYLDAAQLHRLVRSADLVLLPYDSVDQVTSGVLIEAVAAGKPVVSTRFPHAVELLGDGAGLLVDRQDPAAIGAAVRRVLTEPGLAERMSQRADELAPDLSWRAVAGRYLTVGAALRRRHALADLLAGDGGPPATGSAPAPVAVVA